jgi:DNA polymerase/3'-5' exonuclease PolX
MPKRRKKTVSFDAMVKFFMSTYDIPTKKDISKLMDKLDRMEQLIRTTAYGRKKLRNARNLNGRKVIATASDEVFNVIKRFNNGAGFAEIQDRTGFGDKKIRNILFRLNKLGKIRRKKRGVYIAS